MLTHGGTTVSGTFTFNKGGLVVRCVLHEGGQPPLSAPLLPHAAAQSGVWPVPVTLRPLLSCTCSITLPAACWQPAAHRTPALH